MPGASVKCLAPGGGRAIALACVCCAHNTALDHRNMLVSADVGGVFCRTGERKLDDGTGLFSACEQGDLGLCRSYFPCLDGFELAEAIGSDLAEQVLEAQFRIALEPRPRLAVAVELGISLYLAAISLFVIGATCPYCMASLALIAAIFGVVLGQKPPERPGFRWPSWLAQTGAGTVAVLVIFLLLATGDHLSSLAGDHQERAHQSAAGQWFDASRYEDANRRDVGGSWPV